MVLRKICSIFRIIASIYFYFSPKKYGSRELMALNICSRMLPFFLIETTVINTPQFQPNNLVFSTGSRLFHWCVEFLFPPYSPKKFSFRNDFLPKNIFFSDELKKINHDFVESAPDIEFYNQIFGNCVEVDCNFFLAIVEIFWMYHDAFFDKMDVTEHKNQKKYTHISI